MENGFEKERDFYINSGNKAAEFLSCYGYILINYIYFLVHPALFTNSGSQLNKKEKILKRKITRS